MGRGQGVDVGVKGEAVGGGGEWGQASRVPVVLVAAVGQSWGALTLGGKDEKGRGALLGNHRVPLGSHLTS